MSEGDVSLIRDEDVLRRMWQQTEDFSRKKEIRAHMYRLREERLRDLYSPEPPAGKRQGCEFTSAQGHVKSFADQTFQSMKSKEVRDAGSPPKEFTYRGQDLKEHSNAGWNVESENITTDDGHTQVKSVQANIEGSYDVEGGRGQFSARDQHTRAATEYHDDNSSLKRDQSSSNTAAHEQVVRETDGGSHFSSITNSSTSTSNVQQVSSTKHETVPYVTNNEYDLSQQTSNTTNRNEQAMTRREVTNDYEQTTRKNDLQQGELVSRKVDYPDDNTKVVVETRCLPDGTRVTSTRREFRAPVVQCSRSEQHSQKKSESKSYQTSSQQKSDIKEYTSKITHQNIDNQSIDIVSSQKTSDTNDFKQDQEIHYVGKDDTYDSQYKIDRNQFVTNLEQINNKREVISEDFQKQTINERDMPHNVAERVYHTTKDRKIEDVVERKATNDQYQTTYNSDYTQKKVSNDWSPTQQAWASTLRADTPTSTRPSTRASSPGGRTFQSSTSSLRSSVSPDKACRKPPSRGSSPSKVDRSSPTRGTHFSQSVTETKTTRYISPEGRPPHGRSPTRHSQSPEKMPQRKSVSPDKTPQTSNEISQTNDYASESENQRRQSPSPDRKPNNVQANNHPRNTSPPKSRDHDTVSPMHLSQSPSREQGQANETKPGSKLSQPNVFPYRSSVSPDKNLSGSFLRDLSPTKTSRPRKNTPDTERHTNRHPSPSFTFPLDRDAKIRLSTSPDRKLVHQPDLDPSEMHQGKVNTGFDKKPGYMRATAASNTTSDFSKNAPVKSSVSPDRKSPPKSTASQAHVSKITEFKKDHYTFIDEETKMYSRTDNKNIAEHIVTESEYVTDIQKNKHSKSPSPKRNNNYVGSPNNKYRDTPRPTLRKDSRSPSPSKGPVTFTEDHITETRKTQSIETLQKDVNYLSKTTEDVTKPRSTSKDKNPLATEITPTLIKPSKKNLEESSNETQTTISDEKISLSTRRDKSPRKGSDPSSSQSRKTPSESLSPVKRTSKDTQYKMTTDFITSEKTTEELNKKSVLKDHPRQLVTPSTSPTRKSKLNDTAPSTGQSSPTTSVSGFVYFGSPSTEKTIVTDLDDQESYTEMNDSVEYKSIYKRPESLDIKRSPSPSKIPCKSPSQEKRSSPTTENLPRKSSLKKSSFTNQISPTEKPPSSFRVSPTTENQEHPEHKIVKKDTPEKPAPSVITKPKPPLERRETYEDRCRKILGMMDDNKKQLEKNKNQEPVSNLSSPSVSPCLTAQENLSFEYKNKKDMTITHSNVIDFITCEKKEISQQREKSPVPYKTIPSRDSSPTKLQEIISTHTKVKQYGTTCNTDHSEEDILHTKLVEDRVSRKNSSESSPRQSPANKPRSYVSPEKKLIKELPKRNSQSPDKRPEQLKTREDIVATSPNKTFLERKSILEKHTENNKSTAMTRQETYDVEESQVLNNSTLPREPKFISPARSVAKTPSPPQLSQTLSSSSNKTKDAVIEKTVELIISEREQDILDRVQKSLRKLSPERSDKLPSRGNSPTKSTTSFIEIDISTNEYREPSDLEQSEDMTDYTNNIVEKPSNKLRHEKPYDLGDYKIASKPSSRNASPVKKTTIPSPAKSPDSTNKSRSISPKKHFTAIERPQSPQVLKTSGVKAKEVIKKPMSPNKTEKCLITSDVKKNTTKQNSLSKTSTNKTVSKITQYTTNKLAELESKRIPTSKSNNNTSKKEPESRVTRTTSDISIKTKKSSPQRIKSKPEIKVSDASITKSPKTITTNKLQKDSISIHHSILPSKPKSATALNTSTDEDDVIIDVQQAKSSRENSPDRICPTPINFTDDIGTPRYPDEVNEPDDEFRQRTYNTINEVESIVDDIVEICEDDELFVKRKDECFLSFNDNVSNLTNKADKVLKTKDTTKKFKDTEKRMHSDFLDDNLKSDECLLTVSEKVTKFAKGPRDTKDSRSPCRKIVDEYDKNTTYQDDYTKLSVNDKAHLFVETAENIKTNKIKPAVKVDRQDLTDVDESLKSDDCLLSVSDKVNKFVKTAEQFLTHSVEVGEKEKKIKEQHDIIMRKIVENVDNNINNLDANKILTESSDEVDDSNHDRKTTSNTHDEKRGSFSKETASSHAKVKDFPSHNLKPTEKTPIIKITTLRSSEAVKKAKALFENITTTQKTNVKTTKLTDIGVMKKSPKTDSTIVLHPSLEDGSPDLTDVDSEIDAVPHKLDGRGRPLSRTPVRSQPSHVYEDKPRSGAARLSTQSPDISRTKTPIPQSIETTATLKSVTTQQPAQRAVSPYLIQAENEKLPQEKAPGYQRPTKTSQLKEEIKTLEETEVSSRRGSGKFGVELRRTSVERSTVSSERRRSVEHHQPCIEDIFDLDLLEQMLEKVAGYEQRRRIRAQIRIAKKRAETDIYIHKKTTKAATVTKTKSPDRQNQAKSPERHLKSNSLKTHSPDRITLQKCTPDRSQPKNQSLLNGHAKDTAKILPETDQRPHSLEKLAPKVPLKAKSPVRQPSPVKKTRPTSPSKTTTTKPKSNRFNEYASAYLKKAGVSDADKVKVLESKVKKTTGLGDRKSVSQIDERVTENQSTTVSKSYIERKSSKETIERIRTNGRRTPSPEKKSSPERKVESPTERLREKSPSPVLKRQISDTGKKETIIKTVLDSDKKVLPKQAQEERPSWVTNRNLKKITSETRSFSSKKIDSDKSKYRAPSPSKVIAKPLDVITSSYGPGPRDADGKPLFGIRALRNGATNYQVKGTVIREEFHSRDGGAPEGSVSVTAYSSSAEELARLLQAQGERPSRLHGLAAITTTKTFGGDTGHSYKDVHTREERAALDQFTHSDRRVVDSRVEICDVTNSASSHEESHREDKKVEERRETPRQRGEERREQSDRLERRDHRKGEERRESPRRQLQERRERTERIERREDRKAEDRNESPRHLVEERREQSQRTERRQDRKTVRQSSVKSLTEKYIKIASEAPKPSSAYPKAGLILRTAAMKDSVSSDSSQHAGLARTDSEHSLGSVEDVVVSSSTGRGGHVTTTTTTTTTRSRAAPAPASAPANAPAPASASFLDSSTKVTGVQDILTRMKNADIVIREGDTCEDSEARALLNKFLGATVLMAGMQGYVTDQQPAPKRLFKESVRTSSSQVTSSTEEVDLEQCWDERLLRKLLDECTDTEQRRRLRARIRSLMAEQEACATAVTEALAAAGEAADGDGTAREEEEVTTVTSSVRRNSSEKTISSSTTTKTSKVIESMTRPAPKPVSPFAKFRQLEKQNSTNSPNSPKSPQSPGSPSQPFFKFTDPALQASALTIKERLLQWCRDKTRDYENVKLENFSTSWADGLAFCALLHHFLPDAFDYSRLSADKRRHNFTLAFKVADEKAGIYPLLDVDDMVAMRKPDWKCVFTYVQSIHRRFKDQL